MGDTTKDTVLSKKKKGFFRQYYTTLFLRRNETSMGGPPPRRKEGDCRFDDDDDDDADTCDDAVWVRNCNLTPTTKTTKATTRVVVVKCKVHDCDGLCRNKYQIRSRTCGECLRAKEVFVEKEDAAPKRFCQKCTRFHAVTEFEGARKACAKSLKKVAERNWAKKQKTPPPRSSAKRKRTTNDPPNVTENKSKSSGESTNDDTLLNECDDNGGNYKHNNISGSSNIINSNDKNKMAMLRITKLEPSTADTLHALIEKERRFHPVDRVDRLLEAIKAKKRKESLLDIPLISDPKKAKMIIDRQLPLSEREESEEFEEEFDDDDDDDDDDDEFFEDDDLEKERKNRKSNNAHGDGDNNTRKKASKKNELMSLLHNTVRSVTPSLYRGAMEAKFKEFFGRTRSKK